MDINNQQPKTIQENSQIAIENLDFLRKEKSAFLGQLVHNLKNPIGSALSFSEMILDSPDNYPPEKLKRHLNIIKSSCESAISQLEILLIESKIEANNLELYTQETYFSDIIKITLNEYEKYFSKNNLEIDIEFPINEQKIKLDRNLIKHSLYGIFQFLLNYIENNNLLTVKINNNDDFVILIIESKHCANCDKKIEDFFNTNEQGGVSIFKSKPEKYLALKNIASIAKKHQGYLQLEKPSSQSLTVSFALSKEL